MHPVRKRRLTIVVFLLVGLGVAVGLTTYAFRQNINLFYDPSQIAAGEAPVDVSIRAGGMVEKGSVQRDPDSLRVRFRVTDFQSSVPMEYTGILPDLFGEEQGVVATGRMRDDGVFVADEVLAKHDENYMPPEVARSMKEKGGDRVTVESPDTADGVN
ncbi:cytochrome c maturation protein CcmE [Marinobacter sp. JSM 1782161]|uniref:cytochrome c maturation protein CcmE n=1 Tax=Marinobacter sp. JSM 1782161 TaxID=2685906 RepID=UPI001403904B|nr:cytochrome c maturation protein CcmE [Marinobacter sp. JSM 1782161]